MAALNKVQLIGNLGKDPILRFTPSGKAVTDFSLATGWSFIDASGEKKQGTEWHNVTCWGKLAEVVNQYLAKGRQVYVEGRIQTDVVGEGEDRKYYSKVVANQVIFLGNSNGRPVEAEIESSEPLAEEEAVPF